MEREFLGGIESRLYVDKLTYDSWLQLLKGLVMAKERERAHWQLQAQTVVRYPECARYAPIPRHALNFNPGPLTPSRPRSSSPPASSKSYFPFTFNARPGRSLDPGDSMQLEVSIICRSQTVRRFSLRGPPIPRPAKRAIALQTEGISSFGGPRSAGPSFASVGSSTPAHEAFARLTITNTPATYRPDRLQP